MQVTKTIHTYTPTSDGSYRTNKPIKFDCVDSVIEYLQDEGAIEKGSDITIYCNPDNMVGHWESIEKPNKIVSYEYILDGFDHEELLLIYEEI